MKKRCHDCECPFKGHRTNGSPSIQQGSNAAAFTVLDAPTGQSPEQYGSARLRRLVYRRMRRYSFRVDVFVEMSKSMETVEMFVKYRVEGIESLVILIMAFVS